jgi:hypothetical protein
MKKVLIKYNNLTHLDPDYQHRVMDLGDFYQQLPFDTDFEVYHVVDLDYALMKIPPETDWVVVVAAGHCTQDRNLYDKLIVEALKANSPLIGHILNFKDQYPHLHPQIFAFNYQEWIRIQWPNWEYDGAEQQFLGAKIIASKETFHNNYTPHWIRGEDTMLHSVKEMQFGAHVISKFIDIGLTVVNIPEHIRKNKYHLYPDQQWEAFNEFLHGKGYTGTVYEQKNYAQLIGHLDNQVRQQFYVLNTEPLSRPAVNKKIDHYAGVASGLKLVATMFKNGYDNNTTIAHFDFSAPALNFQQYLYHFWDGDLSLYEAVVEAYQTTELDAYPCVPRGTYQENIDYLLKELGMTAKEFKEHWANYRSMTPQFMQLDLYDQIDQFKLAEYCSRFNTSYVWVSNAFWMEYSLIRYGKQQLQEFRENLIRELTSTGAPTILDTEDTWHQGLITINN